MILNVCHLSAFNFPKPLIIALSNNLVYYRLYENHFTGHQIYNFTCDKTTWSDNLELIAVYVHIRI